MDIHKQLRENEGQESFVSLSSTFDMYGITVVDLLLYSLNENTGVPSLSKKVGRSVREVGKYVEALKKSFEDHIIEDNIATCVEPLKTVSTGLHCIDDQLGGGIKMGEITEVLGESGSGKSQFLFQLALNGLTEGSRSILISTEAPLETRRLSDMCNNEEEKMDKILAIYCQDLEIQDHIIFTQLPIELERNNENIKVLAIDSISHHLRRDDIITNLSYIENRVKEVERKFRDDKEFKELRDSKTKVWNNFFKSNPSYEKHTQRAQYVTLLYCHLIQLAEKYNIAVVVSNQVSDYTSDFELQDLSESRPLYLDKQVGFYSGWDNETIYRMSCPSFNRADNEIGRENNSFKGPNNSFESSGYNIHLTLQLKRSSTQTKKHIPALGYQWSKLIESRILLTKFYVPNFKRRRHIKTLTEEKSAKKDVPDEKSHQSNDLEFSGWNSKRYAKVVAVKSEVPNGKTYLKVSFNISKEGLVEETEEQ